MGSLAFYGSESGGKSGWARDYYRARDTDVAADDPFAIHLGDEPSLKALYHDAEHVGQYVSIEDEWYVLTSGRWISSGYECFCG